MSLSSRHSTAIARAVVLGIATLLAASNAAADWVWREAAPLPEERTEVSVASDDDAIYLVGGFAVRGGFEVAAPRGVYRYDPDADAWTRIGDLPEGVNHTAITVLDRKLYVVGGYYEASFDAVGALRILDLDTLAWSEGAPLPTPRGALAIAVLDGRIHAIGGTTADRTTVATHEVYDPVSDSWESAAPLTFRRNHHAAAPAADGRIYVFGGRDEATFRQTISEVYDPSTDSWQRIADLPTGRSGITAAVLDGRIVVFGGESSGPTGRTFDEAEAYDPATDSWTALPPMPVARHGLGAATLDGAIHVISGGPQPGFTFGDMHHVLAFEP